MSLKKEWQFLKKINMDKLINYPNFKSDILISFNKLITEFNLNLVEVHEGRFLLKGNKCTVRITYDRGDIYCGFLLPNVNDLANASYSIWAVNQFLHPKNMNDHLALRSYDPKEQLIEAAKLLDEKLRDVLNGNFEWLDEFLKNDSGDRELSEFVLNHLPYEHPITKKFWGGDSSWKSDVKKIMRKNNR